MNDEAVKHPLLKVASVGAAVLGGLTWGDIASMMAAAYTFLLILDWWWKRFGKVWFRRRGWIKRTPGEHHYMDEKTDNAPFMDTDQFLVDEHYQRERKK